MAPEAMPKDRLISAGCTLRAAPAKAPSPEGKPNSKHQAQQPQGAHARPTQRQPQRQAFGQVVQGDEQA